MVRKMNTLTKVSGASQRTTRSIMIDVLIALLPAAAVGIYHYKVQALTVILTAILASVITEAVWQKACRKKITISDLSAVVTGLMLGLIIPTHVPLWIPVIGSIFATLIVKQFYGGVGDNFMNPAIAAKVLLMTSWAAVMIKPVADDTSGASDAATSAVENLPGLWEMFLTQVTGNTGELSVAALVIGGLYLIVRRVISYRIPLSFILAAAVMSWIIGGSDGLFSGDPIRSSISGVLMLAALFMANDPSSSPKNTVGQIAFGIGCGILAVIIKVYGYNGEGPYYAILIMNLFVPLLDKLSALRVQTVHSKEEAV